MTPTEVMCGLVKNMKVVMEGAHCLASLLNFRLTSAFSSRRKAVGGCHPSRSQLRIADMAKCIYAPRGPHRARAGRGGTLLAFVLPSSEFGKHKAVGGVPSTQHDEEALERISWAQHGRVREHVFDKKRLHGLLSRWDMIAFVAVGSL